MAKIEKISDKSVEGLVSNLEFCKIMYSEYQYRHEHYWKLFFRFSIICLALLAVPFVYNKETALLGDFVFVVPLVSAVLSLLFGWILQGEYIRLASVYRTYINEIDIEFDRVKFEQVSKYKFELINIGHTVTFLFIFGLVTLAFVELVVLLLNS